MSQRITRLFSMLVLSVCCIGSAPSWVLGRENATDRAIAVPNGVVKFASESIDEVIQREAIHPISTSGRTLPLRSRPGAALVKPVFSPFDLGTGGNGNVGILAAETAGLAFQGPGCGCEPPDPTLAVGPSHVLIGINDTVRAVNKSNGSTVWSVSWESFFSSAAPGGAAFASDPKLFYDPVAQRFFATILLINNNVTKSWWMLAVSDTSSITSSNVWTKWSFDPTIATPNFFADFPGFGYDDSAVYITSNMFGNAGGFQVDMAVIPKAQLLAGVSNPTFTQLTNITQSNGQGACTIQPAHMLGTGNGFFASNTCGSGSAIYFYRINNPLGSPSLTKSSRNVSSYSTPPNAAQQGGGNINTGDSRMLNVVWQNNRLWCAHNTNSGGRSAARWYEFDTTSWPSAPTNLQTGTVSNGSAHYYYPTIAVDALNDAFIGFSRSSSTEFASAWHASRFVTDSAGSMGTPTLDHAGTSNYGRTRWGDYSGTVIDPDGMTFWTFQEFANNSGGNFGTWVSSFTLGTPDNTPPTPDPMQWEPGGEPAPISTTAITMQAVLAVDAVSGVEYNFARVSGPGSVVQSGFQASRSFTDTGLIPNTDYGYRNSARDMASTPNVTGQAPKLFAATFIETPTTISFGTVTSNSIQVTSNGTCTNLLTGSSGLFFNMTPAVAGSGANVWVQNKTITVTGLAPNTMYTFQVKARNLNRVETAFGTSNSVSTSAPPCILQGDINQDGLIDGLDIGGYVRAKLGLTPATGEDQTCADFGTGTLSGDTAAFVALLLL